jgi:hypothetical protein
MITLKRTIQIVFTIGALTLATVSSLGQDAKAPFTLTLSTKTNEFRAGADVKLEIVQTNTSDQTIDCTYRGGGGVNLEYSYDVRDEDGNSVEKAVRPHMELDTADIHPCGLAPGDTSSNRILLSRVYKLDRPGKYSIRVSRFAPEIKDDQGNPLKVVSNTITITITG